VSEGAGRLLVEARTRESLRHWTQRARTIEHDDPAFAQENREIVERLRRSSEHL
jgi:hypothetical protein